MMFFMDFDLPHPNDLHLRCLLMQRTCRFLKVAPIRGVSQDSDLRIFPASAVVHVSVSFFWMGGLPIALICKTNLSTWRFDGSKFQCFPPMKFDLWIYSPVANELFFICFVFVR